MPITAARRERVAWHAALNRLLNGDRWPVAEAWAHRPEATTLQPSGGRQVGWAAVWAQWEQLAQLLSGGQITPRDLLIRVTGEPAYTVGIERGEGTLGGQPVRCDYRVTQIYQREAGAWKLIHRHTDVAPVIQDVVSRVPPAPG